jgi:anti-sigma factor RsiW
MKDAESYHELLLRYLDGNLPPEEEAQVADLLRRDPEARVFLREVAEQAVTVADLERVEESRRRELGARHDGAGNRHNVLRRIEGPRNPFARWPWALAVAALIALMANLYFLLANVDPEIVRITELSGSVQWTGDGGRVVHDIEVGSSLRGGTLESLSAHSWSTLAFRDGSTLTISG